MKTVVMFGAGASFNAVPIVSDMVKHIPLFTTILKDPQVMEQCDHKIELTYFIGMLEELNVSLAATSTPDVTLRKFYQSGDKKFERWLEVYWVYLIILQTVRRGDLGLHKSNKIENHYEFVDKRYSSFISDYILDDKDNYRIVSWNYDIQFELAYMHMMSINQFEELYKKLNIWPNLGKTNDEGDNFLIHLNGSSIVYESLVDGVPSISFASNDFDRDIPLAKALNKHLWMLKTENRNLRQLDNTLKFAFTNTEEQLDRLKFEIITSIQDFHKIAIIGYSFPKSNQAIDKFIFNTIDPEAKIIIQNPVSQRKKLISRFGIESHRIIEYLEGHEMGEFIVE